jgi:hypothetical protein
MPTIFCSRKLESLLPKSNLIARADVTPSPIGDWNAHLFTLERKKCLILVNNLSYFVVFINNITKKDLTNMEALVVPRIMEQLQSELKLSGAEAQKLEGMLRSLILARTNNDKRALGVINDSIYIWTVHCKVKYESIEFMPVRWENSVLNEVPRFGSKGHAKLVWPRKAMIKAIRELGSL